MKIYVVMKGRYDEYGISAIFTQKHLALQYINDAHLLNLCWADNDLEIKKHEADKPLDCNKEIKDAQWLTSLRKMRTHKKGE